MSDVKDIERHSLDAHVSLCELRYQALERRIQEVESGIRDLKNMLQEIQNQLQQVNQQQHSRWDRWQVGLIGVLLAVSAWLGIAFFRPLV